MAKRKTPAWKLDEARVCELLGETHVGGNRPLDCEGRRTVTEVKKHRKPVGPGPIEKIAREGAKRGKRARVVATGSGGFSASAERSAAQLGVKLVRGLPIPNPRKRKKAKKRASGGSIVRAGLTMAAAGLFGYALADMLFSPRR